jgi:ketosteroid isomerase-like protein
VIEQFLDNLTTVNWEKLLDLLADDAVIEFPYAPEDCPNKLTGLTEIRPYFESLKQSIRIDEIHPPDIFART